MSRGTGPTQAGGKKAAADYSLRLSPDSATLAAGGVTSTVISFRAGDALYGAVVNLSASWLPDGVRAYFLPRTTVIGGWSVLTLATGAASSPILSAPVMISAITVPAPGIDPIGASAIFHLTATRD